MPEHLSPLSERPYMPERSALSGDEQDRLDALAKPHIFRVFSYLAWLSLAMNEWTGIALAFLTALAGIALASTVLFGLGWAVIHLPWVAAGVGGGALALGGRAIWKDAVATERRYRVSTAEKKHGLDKGGD